MARDYHVAKTGNDSNDGSLQSPWLTIAKARATITGDHQRLFIHAGTYVEELSTAASQWNGGSTFAKRLIISNYGSDTVVIQPGAVLRIADYSSEQTSNMEVVGLDLDGTNLTGDAAIKITYQTALGAAHHIRHTRCLIHHAPIGSGVLITTARYIDFVECDVHHNGLLMPVPDDVSLRHGFYVSSANITLDQCDIHHNGGYGAVFWNGAANTVDDCVIRRSLVHDNSQDLVAGGGGILLGTGARCKAEDNIVWNNRHGILIAYQELDAEIRRNTVFNNTDAQITDDNTDHGTIYDDNRLPVTI